MSGLGNNAMGLQHDKKGILNCPSNASEMANDSVSTMAEPSNAANPFLASSAWDPLVSLSQAHCEFANSLYPLVLENHQGVSSTSHLVVQYMSDSSFGDMVPNVPSYGNGSFSEMVGSFGQQQPVLNNEQSQGEGSTPEDGDSGSAPCENRRKRGLDYNSTFSPDKSAEGDVIKDSSGVKEQDEKKPKVVQNTSASVRGKQSVKQNEENSHSGEAPKENFIHVRARRGQATNSHSLAERVRREKISERMRVLQELVPGCSKITGKAVMLDEIINYVQSLQQQVEFLSMKLATVNPELNIDLERILSKDILQSRIGHGPIGAYGSHPLPAPSFQGALAAMPTTSTQLPPFPQAVLDHEFQSLYGMSYDPSTTLHNMGPNGRLKSEL